MFGLAVLVALGMYVYLAKAFSQFVGRRSCSVLAQYATMAVFVLVPTWDIIPGHLYFNYLCDKQAHTYVLKTVKIDKEFFLSDGRPDEKRLSEYFSQPSKANPKFSFFHITRHESGIHDIKTGEVLGRAISFSYFGGWLNAYLFPQGPPTTCPEYHGSHGMIWQEVIRQKNDSSEKGN